jgi:hypothetical protein
MEEGRNKGGKEVCEVRKEEGREERVGGKKKEGERVRGRKGKKYTGYIIQDTRIQDTG